MWFVCFVWSFENYHCCRVAKFILLRFINCHPLTCRSSTVELTVYLHQSQNRHLLFASCQLPMFIYLVTNETNKLCICCTMSIVDEPSYTFFLNEVNAFWSFNLNPHYKYRKVVSSSLSRLVAHFWIFRQLIKEKSDAYELWPFAR